MAPMCYIGTSQMSEQGNIMLGALPLLGIVVILYNLVAFLTGYTMDGPLVSATMISKAVWTLTLGDVFLILGLGLMFVEIISATRTGTATIVNHALSMLLLLVAVIEFIVLPQFATSVFLMLILYCLIDVVAGFTVTITAARRDLAMTDALR